jgi:hypothetical protein
MAETTELSDQEAVALMYNEGQSPYQLAKKWLEQESEIEKLRHDNEMLKKLVGDGLYSRRKALQEHADRLEKAAAGYASFLAVLIDELEIEPEETEITVKGNNGEVLAVLNLAKLIDESELALSDYKQWKEGIGDDTLMACDAFYAAHSEIIRQALEAMATKDAYRLTAEEVPPFLPGEKEKLTEVMRER